MNPLQKTIKNYQHGIISLLELKILFFEILGTKSCQIPENIPDGILESLIDYANSLPMTDSEWEELKLHQIGSCCCQAPCAHLEKRFPKTILRNGIKKFRSVID